MIEEALERLRLRLLDLTSRNRLLNFKPSSAKSIQIVEAVPNAVYDRLLDGRACTFSPVPDPAPMDYIFQDGRRIKPDVREYAKRRGIDVNHDLPRWDESLPATGVEGSRLRALLYPEELERQCRRIMREAQSSIEETGTNMLYLVFGSLEFYESDDSDRPLNAPLLAVPVSLKRRSNPQTGLYLYDLTYSGEEITENLSLREKLDREFCIQLPELREDERPEAYIERIRQVIGHRDRWKVKRQMTLGLLSFTKMILFRDLDQNNWPKGKDGRTLIEHPIVQKVFRGSEDGSSHAPTPIPVDDCQENGFSLELIYDADTSQHGALNDALSGKNIVINGPPGTGKSQTITNLIALEMRRGKKVLFVSEKLAALEVVKSRLDQAGLGGFCLELHSYKTDKKRVVEEIRKRKDGRYSAPDGLNEKIESRDRHRKCLKRYADLMNSKFGNELNLSVFDILWKAERYRQKAAFSAANGEVLVVEEAPGANSVKLDEMRQAIVNLAQHYREIGSFGAGHPWFGFSLKALKPGDDLGIQKLLRTFIEEAEKFDEAMTALRREAWAYVPSEKAELEAFARSVERLPVPGPGVIIELFPRFFSSSDMKDGTCQQIIEELQQIIEELGKLCDEARELANVYQGKLIDPEVVNEATHDSVQKDIKLYGPIANRTLAQLSDVVSCLRSKAKNIGPATDFFRGKAELIGQPFDGTDASIQRIQDIIGIAHRAPLELLIFRHHGLDHFSAREKFVNARNQLSELKQEQQALKENFWLDDMPEEADLQQAIHILRRGDAWYRFLQRDWRHACRFHKVLSRDSKAKKTGSDRLRELAVLAEHLKRIRQFQKNREYSETFGPLFQGLETDFEKVGKLVTWYEQGREILLRRGLGPTEFSLTTFDGFRLSQLALHHEACQDHSSLLKDASEYIDVNLRYTRAYGDVGDIRRPWSERRTALESFLTEIDISLGRLTLLSPPTLTPEEVLKAVTARCGYIVLLKQIRTQHAVERLLGEYFAGVETDFARIFETIAWGRKVAKASIPEATKTMLLSSEARPRLIALKQASSASWELAGFDDCFADGMRRYGRFNWKQWNSVLLAVDSKDPIRMMCERAALAIKNVNGLLPWAQYNSVREKVLQLGLKVFAEKLEAGDINSDMLEDTFLYNFYASIMQSIFCSKAELRKFSGLSHQNVREEFAKLDREVIDLRGKECSARIASHASPPAGVSSVRVDEKTEMALLSHLMTLQRPRTPIREMIRRAGRAIQALKPCFMMSPLSVAQYLKPGAVEFDLVVMDEASQLKVEEALGAIARGKQLVVVGDPKQLPPTSFFDRSMTTDDEQDEETTVTASESILDICDPLFSARTLRWHYRSKHESLIAFSNHHFYDGRLIVFPSPYPKTKRLGLRFHFVRDGIYQNRQNHREAERVVDAVLDHMRCHPDESLGVVTLNITQRELIEDVLENRLRLQDCGDGENYKTKWEKEGWPFFVKNLENVQGDERDVIFVSTTFGYAPGTTVPVVRQNFGPISRPNGWRRLNVLFTRARKSLHVFSSMRPEDIKIEENTPGGTRALRNYLEYAASGVLVDHGPGLDSRPPDSDFELVVADALRNKGYEVQPQLGAAGYFIDIAVRNPDRHGEFIAAIECDGATYHSGKSVRDRDRIRQEILESLGWRGKIWRIWSTDWFRSPSNEIHRLLEFLEKRCKAAKDEVPPDAGESTDDGERNAGSGRSPGSVQLDLETQAIDEDEKLYIEVGDTVFYCDVNNPAERKCVLITDGPSDFEQGIFNEATPLAKALLDKAESEEIDLILPGKEPRRFRVLQIARNNSPRPG